jgi:hypothetical protein
MTFAHMVSIYRQAGIKKTMMIGISYKDICHKDYASDLSSTHTHTSVDESTYICTQDDMMILTNKHMHLGFFSIRSNPLQGLIVVIIKFQVVAIIVVEHSIICFPCYSMPLYIDQ